MDSASTHTVTHTPHPYADLEGGGLGGPPPLSPENLNFFNLHSKITQNMPRTTHGKHNFPSDPSLKNFLDPHMPPTLKGILF